MAMTLDHLKVNQTAIVRRLDPQTGGEVLMSKLADMGLYPGKKVEVLFKAPSGDPIAIDIEGYTLSLRKFEASLIEVVEE